ncbi:hypothetical protein EBZ39_01845 [bacterium]|nr:hypothetical protein [bacterium]
MTTFQLFAVGLFAVVAGVAYRNELVKLVSKFLVKPTGVPTTAPSVALTIVGDLVSVTELRDKLAAENCAEGVEACTNLLRVIVEQTRPSVKAG